MGSLRLLLAISVVLAHAGGIFYFNGIVGGQQAVQCFFILSGFYMALVLHEKYDRAGPFYWNRVSRIFSGYWVALAVAVVAGFLIGPNMYANIFTSSLDGASKALLLVANTVLLGSDAAMFLYPGDHGLAFTSNFAAHDLRLHPYLYIPQAWSLPVELAFYAIAPFITRSKLLLVALAVASLVTRYLTYHFFGSNDPWTYRFFPNELFFFAVGALSYHLYAQAKNWQFSRPVGWVLTAVVLYFVLNFERWNPLYYYFPTGTAGILLFTVIAMATPFIFIATKDIKFDRWLGEISYMIYLVHIVIIRSWPALTGEPGSPLLFVVLSIAAAAALHPVPARLDRLIRGAYRRYRSDVRPVDQSLAT